MKETDIVFTGSGKIGYGTVSEALAYKLPFVFVRRDYFNEEPFLRNMLEVLILLFSPVLSLIFVKDLISDHVEFVLNLKFNLKTMQYAVLLLMLISIG